MHYPGFAGPDAPLRIRCPDPLPGFDTALHRNAGRQMRARWSIAAVDDPAPAATTPPGGVRTTPGGGLWTTGAGGLWMTFGGGLWMTLGDGGAAFVGAGAGAGEAAPRG